MHMIVQRDTRAWRFQVWASFAIAVFLCAAGLTCLPGQDIDRAFRVMGLSVLPLGDVCRVEICTRQPDQQRRYAVWRWVVFGAFSFAMTLTGCGLWRMTINETYKAFLFVGWLFLISSTFTLAKAIRDAHDANALEARLNVRSGTSNAS